MNEIDMLIIVLLLIISITPLIVFLDATKNKIAGAGSWTIFVFAIWIIGLPVYLFKRKSLIKKAQEAPVEEEQRTTKIIAVSFMCILYFSFISYMSFKDEIRTINNTQQAGSSIVTVNIDKFNTTDKFISLNGNLEIAISKINKMGIHSIGDMAEQTTAEIITKSPYSALGKPYNITGKIYKVEELPPGDHEGRWSEILLLTKNLNSPLGTTTIDFLFNGDISKIRPGQIVTCSGFFIGTFESSNAMGGKVEAVVLVGNELRIK